MVVESNMNDEKMNMHMRSKALSQFGAYCSHVIAFGLGPHHDNIQCQEAQKLSAVEGC